MEFRVFIVLGMVVSSLGLYEPTTEEDEMVSQTLLQCVNCTVKEPIVLYDTSKNFDYVFSSLTIKRNIEKQNYLMNICVVTTESDLNNCSKNNLIAAKFVNTSQVNSIMTKVYADFYSKLFIIITNEDIDIKYSLKIPVFSSLIYRTWFLYQRMK